MEHTGDSSIPHEMQALVLTAPGKFEVRGIKVPLPGPGEVLCKIRAVAICGSDPEIIRGDLAGIWPPDYPFTPGHEWTGEVVAVGPGVNQFVTGDRVVGEAHKGCGYCQNCLNGRYNLCLNYGRSQTGHAHYGFTTAGAYGQYAVFSSKAITGLDRAVSFVEGALIDTAGAVLHGMELSGITTGGDVVVIGPGPIGLIATRLAKAMGAARVIVIGRGARLEKARQLCADVVINFEENDPVQSISDLTGGDGVNEVFECSGANGTLDQGIQMVCKGGKVVLLGVPPTSAREEISFRSIIQNEVSIIGSRANPNVAWKLSSLLSSGQLYVRDLVTHVFPLNQFDEALQTFLERREGAIKVVVEPNGSESGVTL